MKIAVLSSHTSSLFWFRMDMMKDFTNNGHSVIAVGPEPEAIWNHKFEAYKVKYKQIYVNRNSTNLIYDLKTFIELCSFIKKEKPDKIFTYQAKTIIYGCLAARANGVNEVYPLIAGLGSIIRGSGLKNIIIKKLLKLQYKVALKVSKKVFFQNNDDKHEFIKDGLVSKDKTVTINGSGVNVLRFQPVSLPNEPVFLFIGRLIKDKGVVEYLKACKRVKVLFPNVRCLLVGPYDSNPSALRPEELKYYTDRNIVEYFGEQTDVRTYIAQCSTFILPSYHEGTPKTVLEAMAMGRSIITSDTPGCRETVTNGHNGFLVDVKDVCGLVAKMKTLITDPKLNKVMGERSLKLVREKYDVKLVNKAIMESMKL